MSDNFSEISNSTFFNMTDMQAATTDRLENADWLRLMLASLVVLSHAAAVSGDQVTPYFDPIRALTGNTYHLGAFAVMCFFALSGYLVTTSWERLEDPIVFLKARILRIYPALFAVLLLTAFLLGPIVTADPMYLQRSEPYLYVLTHLGMSDQIRQLPGVLNNNPYTYTLNGPLWTLPLEFACYVSLAGLGLFRLFNRKSALAVALVLTALIIVEPNSRQSNLLLYGQQFAAGAALYHLRALPIWNSRTFFLTTFGALAICAGGYSALAFCVWIPYLTLVLARGRWARGWGRWGDMSYGLYVWAFVVQQIVAHVFPDLRWPLALLVSYPASLVVAWLSWHFIEGPALRLKRSSTPAVKLRTAGSDQPLPTDSA